MIDKALMREEFQENGFLILSGIAPLALVADLIQQVARLRIHPESPGTRTLLRHSYFRNLVEMTWMQELAALALGKPSFAVRGIYFDKSPAANWTLGWHQDLKIPVQERTETEGFSAWSVKEGVIHVQPPREILENMVAVRLHLDDSGLDNGPLECVPRSHRTDFVQPESEFDGLSRPCPCPRGGVILMSPLCQHRSGKSTSSRSRRVLHFEMACIDLPDGLKWADWRSG